MRKRFMMVAVTLLLGSVPAVVVVAANTQSMVAQSKTERDAANIAMVKTFVHGWNEPAKAAEYLSDKASVRMEEDKPALIGKQPFIDAWKGYFQHGEKISVKVLDVFARGPVVVTHRIDTVVTPGKPDQTFDVVGVFVVKDGKIVEWVDYLNK